MVLRTTEKQFILPEDEGLAEFVMVGVLMLCGVALASAAPRWAPIAREAKPWAELNGDSPI